MTTNVEGTRPSLVWVFLPILVLGLVCVSTPVLVPLSDGGLARPSLIAAVAGFLSSVLCTIGLVIVRRGRRLGAVFLVAGALLATAMVGYGAYHFERLVQLAQAGADDESVDVIREHASRERPWVYLGALLGLLPSVGGGGAGYFAMRRRGT